MLPTVLLKNHLMHDCYKNVSQDYVFQMKLQMFHKLHYLTFFYKIVLKIMSEVNIF